MARKKQIITSVHAVVGSDDLAVKREAAALAHKLAPAEAGEFGLETVDGASDNVEQAAMAIRSVVAALQTLPFFGGGKLVWLKSANFLGDDIKGKSATVLERLQDLSELIGSGLPEGVVLLISAINPDKRRSFYKTLVKIAEVQVFDEPDISRSGWEENAAEIVRAEADKRKLRFEEEALELFVLSTGGDPRSIANELEKLTLYARGPSITLRDVRELVPVSRAGVIFELGGALAKRDLTAALNLTRDLLDQGETAIAILLATIVPTVRNLLLAKQLMEQYNLPRPHAPFAFISAVNRLPESSVQHLPRKKDGTVNTYALGIAAMNAHHFETTRLVAAMEACLQANLQLVTTQLDHQLVLTEIIVKMLAA